VAGIVEFDACVVEGAAAEGGAAEVIRDGAEDRADRGARIAGVARHVGVDRTVLAALG
jgi:hypothetical protein